MGAMPSSRPLGWHCFSVFHPICGTLRLPTPEKRPTMPGSRPSPLMPGDSSLPSKRV